MSTYEEEFCSIIDFKALQEKCHRLGTENDIDGLDEYAEYLYNNANSNVFCEFITQILLNDVSFMREPPWSDSMELALIYEAAPQKAIDDANDAVQDYLEQKKRTKTEKK